MLVSHGNTRQLATIFAQPWFVGLFCVFLSAVEMKLCNKSVPRHGKPNTEPRLQQPFWLKIPAQNLCKVCPQAGGRCPPTKTSKEQWLLVGCGMARELCQGMATFTASAAVMPTWSSKALVHMKHHETIERRQQRIVRSTHQSDRFSHAGLVLACWPNQEMLIQFQTLLRTHTSDMSYA